MFSPEWVVYLTPPPLKAQESFQKRGAERRWVTTKKQYFGAALEQMCIGADSSSERMHGTFANPSQTKSQ